MKRPVSQLVIVLFIFVGSCVYDDLAPKQISVTQTPCVLTQFLSTSYSYDNGRYVGNSTNNGLWWTTIAYNTKGQKVSATSVTPSLNLIDSTFFDESQRMVKFKGFQNGILTGITTFTYNASGQCVKQVDVSIDKSSDPPDSVVTVYQYPNSVTLDYSTQLVTSYRSNSDPPDPANTVTFEYDDNPNPFRGLEPISDFYTILPDHNCVKMVAYSQQYDGNILVPYISTATWKYMYNSDKFPASVILTETHPSDTVIGPAMNFTYSNCK